MKDNQIQLLGYLRRAWSPASARQWTAERPADGQCNVTSAFVQERLGGEILKTMLPAGWHFYSKIKGQRVDFTAEQFDTPISYDDVESDREEALAGARTDEYRALSQRLAHLETGR